MFHEDPLPPPHGQPAPLSGDADKVKLVFALGFITGILTLCTIGFFILLLVVLT